MKTQKLILGIIEMLAAIGLIVSACTGFTLMDKSIAGLILMIVSGLLVIAGAVVSYLVNDKVGTMALLSGSIVGLVAFRINIDVFKNWQLVVSFFSTLLSLVLTIINYIGFDKKDEKILKRINIPATLISVVLIVFIVVLLLDLFKTNAFITPITLITAVILIVAAKVLHIAFKFKFSSLLMLLVPLIVVMGIVPYEIGQNDNNGIISVIVYILSFVVLLGEIGALKE